MPLNSNTRSRRGYRARQRQRPIQGRVAYFRIFPDLNSVADWLLQTASCHKRQKPQAPIRNRQTRKVANAKGLNRNTNLT